MEPSILFDFIADPDLRQNLESDYREMNADFQSGSWKSAKVIAGSIVEALLADYLLGLPAYNANDVLKMDLATAVKECQSHGALSARNADLCSVVRSYRNLIHPGRMVRLGEPTPNRTSAQVAVSLVELIVEDIAKARRATAGLTAEQIVSKVARDSHTTSIVQHLLRDVRREQQVRLLTKVLPGALRAVIEQQQHDFVDLDAKARLTSLYRSCFLAGDDSLRRAAMAEFVRVLREEDGDWVTEFGNAFVYGAYLEWVPEDKLDMVREHLINRAASHKTHSSESLQLVDGISPWIEEPLVAKWSMPYVRTIFTKGDVWARARRQFIRDALTLEEDVRQVLDGKLEQMENNYAEHDRPEEAVLAGLRRDISGSDDDDGVPF